MTRPVYAHVYASSAVVPLSTDELLALLEQAREKNARLGVTGMLLYKDGNFLQVLEGDEDVVRSLLETIRRDPRHRGMMKILDGHGEREFAGWSMGFHHLRPEVPIDVPGYSEFMNDPLTPEAFSGNPSRARRLLQVFRKVVR